MPLIAAGQSQAGGTAQLQVAHVLAADNKALLDSFNGLRLGKLLADLRAT